MDETPTKLCKKCGRTLPTTNFWKDLGRKDWLDPTCRDCHRINARKRYATRKEAQRRMLEPLKIKARSALRNAVKRGEIPKEICFLCEELKTEAHHLDYNYPLKVVWLCKKHHEDVHHA